MRHPFQTDMSHMCHACEGQELPFFGQSQSGRQSVVFVTCHEFELDFGAITLLFSIAPLSGVQLENIGVMLLKFYSDSLLVTNSCSATLGWI
jgi:hypothetical protein